MDATPAEMTQHAPSDSEGQEGQDPANRVTQLLSDSDSQIEHLSHFVWVGEEYINRVKLESKIETQSSSLK